MENNRIKSLTKENQIFAEILKICSFISPLLFNIKNLSKNHIEFHQLISKDFLVFQSTHAALKKSSTSKSNFVSLLNHKRKMENFGIDTQGNPNNTEKKLKLHYNYVIKISFPDTIFHFHFFLLSFSDLTSLLFIFCCYY